MCVFNEFVKYILSDREPDYIRMEPSTSSLGPSFLDCDRSFFKKIAVESLLGFSATQCCRTSSTSRTNDTLYKWSSKSSGRIKSW